jgi:Flp pilus assembly protein TadG
VIVRNFLKSLRGDQQGTTAVEFAIIAPVFIALVVGTMALCVGLFLIGSLHFAVEDGARCASVKTTICSDEASTVAYTQSRYFGPNVSPTFTCAGSTCGGATATCGNSVTGSISYSMDVGFKTFVIPIRATACFP